jgi:aminopeptidase N
VNYLVSLVVGRFDVESVSSGKLSMPVYVPPGRGRDIKRTYGNTPAMVDLFSNLTGQPYPWDQYAQLVVWNFGAGGMENTSATTLYDTAILSPEGLADGDIDGLISHELAHQWFGDLITCKSWEHIWLNEGFATYFTHLWFERRDGRDAYLGGVLGNFDRVAAADKADAPYQPAMVSKEYQHPGDTFRRAANPYPKGSAILHMLRLRLGDEVFFKALGVYVDRFKFKLVETADLRRVMEEVSGETLEKFFNQWCYHPGVPDLDIACDWKADTGELVVTVEQKQTINGYNPAFEFSLPLTVQTQAGSSIRMPAVEVTQRRTVAAFKLDAEPTMVMVDPDLSVLARSTIRQPMRRWLAQLDRAPTLASRIQAARALKADESSISADSLAKAAAATSSPPRLRVECVNALVARHQAATLAELSRADIADRDTREALMDGIAEALNTKPAQPGDRQRLSEYAASVAAKDVSGRVRQSALRAVGKLKLADRLSVLTDALRVESQHDRVRQGALEGLGDLDVAAGLPIAIQFSQPGTLSRTRPIAIQAIAKLAHHDQAVAVKALLDLQSDREPRARNEAAQALITLRAQAAVPVWEAELAKQKDPDQLQRLRGWINALKDPPNPAK